MVAGAGTIDRAMPGTAMSAPDAGLPVARAAIDASDEALMLVYAAGDPNAFARLYRRYHDRLHRYLMRVCSSPAQAEEVFQEVWMAVIARRGRYRPQASFASYLFAIAYRRCAEQGRQARRGADLIDDDESPALDALADLATPHPEDVLQNAQLASDLLAATAQLPLPQRETFLLKAEGGLKLEEIAQITGVSRETAKSRLRYATAKLREQLQNWR